MEEAEEAVPREARRTRTHAYLGDVEADQLPTSHNLDEKVFHHPSQPPVPVRKEPSVVDRKGGVHAAQRAGAAAGVPAGAVGA